MAAKTRRKDGAGRTQLILAIAALGFIVFLLAYSVGFAGLGAEMFVLIEGVFLALVTLYCLWKFDSIEKRLAVLASGR
jgi:hypothetical protein